MLTTEETVANTNGKQRPNLARRIIGDLLILASVLLTVDVSVVMLNKINKVVLKSIYVKSFVYELIMLAILILFALDVRFGIFTKIKNKVAKVIGWVLRVIVTLLTATILFMCARVVIGGMINTSEPVSNVLVLGMALEDGQPTKDLLMRVDTAKAYLDKNSDATLVLTGGNAGPEGRTEAEVMRDLLIERGAPEDSMRLEDQASNTIQNFQNTIEMVDPAEAIVLVSSNYHMNRAVKLAKQAGFENVLRLPAPSNFFQYGSNMMWELVMELNQLMGK